MTTRSIDRSFLSAFLLTLFLVSGNGCTTNTVTMNDNSQQLAWLHNANPQADAQAALENNDFRSFESEIQGKYKFQTYKTRNRLLSDINTKRAKSFRENFVLKQKCITKSKVANDIEVPIIAITNSKDM